MARRTDITMSFNSVDKLNLEKIQSDIKVGFHEKQSFTKFQYEDLDEILEQFGSDGTYNTLYICLRFMNNLYPEDLYMFFDELIAIEQRIFEGREINSDCILSAYKKYKYMIQDNYVEFIINYYRESVGNMFNNPEQYNQEQIDFMIMRNRVMYDLLPSIGERLSNHYVDVITSNTCDSGIY